MAGYRGTSMSNNAVVAYEEGKKPVSKITKDDIQKYGVNEGITFFRWFIKKYCHSCEWHHSSPKFNVTYFYDIEACCEVFKREDTNRLKEEYKHQSKSKPAKEVDNNPYYAKVEYSISTYSNKRKYINAYAIVHKCWAYIKDNYKKEIIKKKIEGKHFRILERYESKPEKMPEDEANALLEKIRQ